MAAIFRVQKNSLVLAILFFLAIPVVAQDTTASGPQSASETGDARLQKDVQNPVASLILVPLQNNTNFDSGPFNRTQNVFNIQPVSPVTLINSCKLILRILHPPV